MHVNKRYEILSLIEHRWGITALNPMQQEVVNQNADSDVILYSPTGSGKTMAFAISLVESLTDNGAGVQAVVIAPSRELALQTHDTLRTLAVGHKVTCFYGGHHASEERQSLSVIPSVVVATPGRLLDHVNHGRIDLKNVKMLVLDEFDKCLELGFEEEMRRLLRHIPHGARRMLTSATRLNPIPDYVAMHNAITLDYLMMTEDPASRMAVHAVYSPEADKLETLRRLLFTIEPARTIVFVGYRDAVARVAEYLVHHHVSAGVYHGALAQTDRETALALFRNDSVRVLVSTDLAARGLDIAGVQHIIHYHLPATVEAYTHRNGRTARVDAHGEIYVLLGPDESCPDFVTFNDELSLSVAPVRKSLLAPMTTLHIKAGKKEKISRGDIVGFIAKNSSDILQASDIGHIEVKDHHTLVAVPHRTAQALVNRLSHLPLKGHHTRITIIRR